MSSNTSTGSDVMPFSRKSRVPLWVEHDPERARAAPGPFEKVHSPKATSQALAPGRRERSAAPDARVCSRGQRGIRPLRSALEQPNPIKALSASHTFSTWLAKVSLSSRIEGQDSLPTWLSTHMCAFTLQGAARDGMVEPLIPRSAVREAWNTITRPRERRWPPLQQQVVVVLGGGEQSYQRSLS